MICRKCKLTKDSNEFVNCKSKKSGKITLCKECKKILDNISYRKRRDSILKQKKDKKSSLLYELSKIKIEGCKKCGERRQYLLDFHHLKGNKKDFNIGSSIFRGKSFDIILSEIDKCIILCSNCHREFHFFERIDGITIEHYLDCHMV